MNEWISDTATPRDRAQVSVAFDYHCGTATVTILPRVSFGYSSNRPGRLEISWINDHHHLTSPGSPGQFPIFGWFKGWGDSGEGRLSGIELISQDRAVTPFPSAEEVTFKIDGLRKRSIWLPCEQHIWCDRVWVSKVKGDISQRF